LPGRLSESLGAIKSAILSSVGDSMVMVTTVTPEGIEIKDIGCRSCPDSNGHMSTSARTRLLALLADRWEARTDQPVACQRAGPGDSMRLQEVHDGRRQHDIGFVCPHFSAERGNQLIEGG